jgi:hypothetical protein
MRAVDRDLIRGGHYGQRSSVYRANRPNTWLLRPTPQVKILLANLEPSTHGPTRKSRDVRFRAAIRGIADVKRRPPIYEYTPFCNGPDDVKPPE